MGVLTYKDGSVYKGTVKKGRPNGEGTYTFDDGDVYIGRMKKGKFHGQGKYYSGGVTLIYEGAWKNDEKHGFGTEYYDDGGKYIGNLKKGERHGKGTIYYPEGEHFKTYTGRFVHDVAKGKGERTYSNGMVVKAVYDGEEINKGRRLEWNLDDKNSYVGTITADGKFLHGKQVTPEGEWYDGDWKDFKPHGRGTWHYLNGNEYEGELKDGKRHGYGTMKYKSGDKLVSNWKNDMPLGKHTYYWANGDRCEGEYHADGTSSGKMYYADGSTGYRRWDKHRKALN